MIIYIIGGNGFLGTHVIKNLREQFNNQMVVNLDISVKNDTKYSKKVNISNLDSLEKIFNKNQL